MATKKVSPGRPPIPEEERASTKFCMRLSSEDKKSFTEFARKKRLSLARLVREAGYFFIEKNRWKELGSLPTVDCEAQFQMLLTPEDYKAFSEFATDRGWSMAAFLCHAVTVYMQESA